MTVAERYQVLGRVATTRTGAVWKARDVSLDRLVALKEVTAADRSPLYREAAAIAAIASDHIVEVYGVEDDGTTAVLVEEWVDGATVAAVVRHNGRMPAAQALGVLRGALLGLTAAHRAGLVHGDISLSNILVDASGRARLIDFGSVTAAGAIAQPATGAFAAPEVVAGHLATPAADVYASAAVLAALLRGQLDTRPTTDGIDGPVRAVLDRALAAAPEQRYPDAAAFLAALEAAAQQTYGIGWWTQAGLGAAAVASVAALLPVAAAVAGAGAAAGSGAVAAGSGTAGTGVATATSTAGQFSAEATAHAPAAIGKGVGRALWHSRRLLYGVGGAAAATAVGVTIAVASSSSSPSAPSGANIIRDPGAEAAATNPNGTHVPTPAWTVTSGDNFTAARYGVIGLPAGTDPGPTDRGNNLFTGGESGDTSTGTQIDSLSAYASRIRGGQARFTLSAYLGGYSSQTDNATLTVRWRDSSGAAVGPPTTIGPVTADQRKSLTGLFPRSATGTVPAQATSVLVTLSMMRQDGSYVDGYADNLSLTIR